MILSKDTIVQNIVNELSDNSTGQISPYDIRHNLLDIIDSVHLLLKDKELDVSNVGTFDVRTTRLGYLSLENYNIQNAVCEDNSAFGYHSLKSNYQGIQNTAIGSFSLDCNIHGEQNVGLGYNSLSSNTIGHGNVGLGNNTLKRNRFGSFNIAIGNAAGYYVDKTTNNKLFIASHSVDDTHVCENPLGSGWTPLVYGDLSRDSLRFGIATNTLHQEGTLQVSGEISPTKTSSYDLGTDNYKWSSAYLSHNIVFPSGKQLGFDYVNNGLSLSSNIVPSEHDTYNLGTKDKRFSQAYFDDIFVSGTATIQNYVYRNISSCTYNCKTLYLATSTLCSPNNPCGYLSNANLNGAGIVLKSREPNLVGIGIGNIIGGILIGSQYIDYDYKFDFHKVDNSLSNLQEDTIYSRSSWNSNISLHVASGCHVKTNRVLGSGSLAFIDQSNDYGMIMRNNTFYLGEEKLTKSDPKINKTISGVGNVNFFSPSGSNDDFIITYAGLERYTNVTQRFLSGAKHNSLRTLNGFEVKCFDDETQPIDRYTISSFNSSKHPTNTITLMKSYGDGVFGINNFNSSVGQNLLPDTFINGRSRKEAVVRITAETNNFAKSSLQLLSPENCLNSGIELTYNNSGVADLIFYDNFMQESFLKFDKSRMIGIFAASGNMNEMLTIGGSGYTESVISIHETDTDSEIEGNEDYGKVFVKENHQKDQSGSLYFVDSSGNLFDLVSNKLNSNSNSLYVDELGNTLGGIGCSEDRRPLLDFLAANNTAFGYQALNGLASGINNIAIGSKAANGIVNGENNIAIGFHAMQDSGDDLYNNIVIGNSALGSQLETSNTLLIGNGSSPLVSGDLRSDVRHLYMPNSGVLELQSQDNQECLWLSNNTIEVKGVGDNNYPENKLSFKFTSNETAELLVLQHSGEPLSTNPTYAFSDSGIPYAELKGDLRILNAIRFNDGTSMYTTSGVDLNIDSLYASGEQVLDLAKDNENRIQDIEDLVYSVEGLFIEGIAQEKINQGSLNSPSNGIIKTGNNTEFTISNRDPSLVIDARDFVIAVKIGSEYRPIWISSPTQSGSNGSCDCCGK